MLVLAIAAAALAFASPASQCVRLTREQLGSRLLKGADPVYPDDARVMHIQGVVRFSVEIDERGRPSRVHLVSGHPKLVRAARNAVAAHVYKPVLVHGRPVCAIGEVDVSFVLPPNTNRPARSRERHA